VLHRVNRIDSLNHVYKVLRIRRRAELDKVHTGNVKTDKSCTVAGKPRDATVNFDRYGVNLYGSFYLIILKAVDIATYVLKC